MGLEGVIKVNNSFTESYHWKNYWRVDYLTYLLLTSILLMLQLLTLLLHHRVTDRMKQLDTSAMPHCVPNQSTTVRPPVWHGRTSITDKTHMPGSPGDPINPDPFDITTISARYFICICLYIRANCATIFCSTEVEQPSSKQPRELGHHENVNECKVSNPHEGCC